MSNPPGGLVGGTLRKSEGGGPLSAGVSKMARMFSAVRVELISLKFLQEASNALAVVVVG